MTPETVKESIQVRGVCASIQAMAMPTINNLISLFEKVGIKLKKEN